MESIDYYRSFTMQELIKKLNGGTAETRLEALKELGFEPKNNK